MNRTTDLELKEMFRKLYPSLSEADLERSPVNFDRYLALVIRIADRDPRLIDGLSNETLP